MWQLVVLEQGPQIEVGRCQLATRRVLFRLGIDDPVERERSRRTGESGVDEQIRRSPLHLHRTSVAPTQRQQWIGVLERGE